MEFSKAIKLIIILPLLLACGNEYQEHSDRQEAIDYVNSSYFVRHQKSGLCFAISHPGWNSAVMAEVPCDAVKDLLINKK